ncbi:MAG: GFA family protein [Pseudomonadota bacterium]
MTNTPYTGGCLCGAVTYEVTAEPMMTGICHCKNCQRQAGSAFSILTAVPKSAVTVTGTLTEFEDTADSGNPVFRRFCGRCGSPLFSLVPSAPDMIFIKAGTLDDTSSLEPQVHFWCDSAQPWVPIDENLPKTPKNPPS